MSVASFFAPALRVEGPQVAPHGGMTWLALPFDALRAQYAAAVAAGFIDRSLLDSGRVERALAALEQFVLGPWARRV